jgi:ribosome-associated protein
MIQKTEVKNLPTTLQAAIQGIEEVKGNQIILIDLKNITSRICDYFVVCHGDSSTQVSSIAESIERETKKATNEKAWHVEGKLNGEWVLVDYGNFIVHVFHKETRDFYSIESLWGDAILTQISDDFNI